MHDGRAPQNAVGVTPLIMSARQGFNTIVTYLIDTLQKVCKDEAEFKANLDIKSTAGLGLCAMDGAATRGHASTLRLLASRGADIAARRTNGRTPLHSAAAFGHASCVRELLALGADPTLVDNDGKLPAELVTKSCSTSAWPTMDYDEVLQLLREAVEAKKPKA